MDQRSFDRIARLLGGAASRRAGVKAALGAALGLAIGAGEAGAGQPSKGKDAGAGRDKGTGKGKGRGKDRDRDRDRGSSRPGIEGPCGNGKRKDNICTSDGDCCTGICNLKTGKTNKDGLGRCRCLKRGKTCDSDRNCCGNLTCLKGTCASQRPGPNPTPSSPVPTGYPCTPNDTCESSQASCIPYASDSPPGLYCLLQNGGTCTAAKECVGQTCTNGVCDQTTIPTGDPCEQGDVCADAAATCTTYTSNDPTGTFCLLADGGACFGAEDCTGQLCVAGTCASSPEQCDVCQTCTYQTIQAAIDGVAPGSVIRIDEGDYTEDLTVDKDLTLRACNGVPVTITNATTPRRVIQRTVNSGDPVALTIGDITIRRNESSDYGGGIWGYFDLTLSGTTIVEKGHAYRYGGGVELGDGSNMWDIDDPLPCTLILEGRAQVRGNEADDAAGGIWMGCRGGRVIIRGRASVTSNVAPGSGGGFATTQEIDITITDEAYIGGNSAGYGGGGFSAQDYATVRVSGSAKVIGNSCGDDGGGFFVDSYGSVALSGNVVVAENTSGWEGGGVYAYEFVTVTMSGDVEVRDNTAVRGGGGVYVDGYYESKNEDRPELTVGLLMQDRARIHSNSVSMEYEEGWTRGGGGAMVRGGSPVVLSDQASIDSNSAAATGGGLLTSGDVTLKGTSSIKGNEASEDGGGIWLTPYYDEREPVVKVGANAKLTNNTPNNCAGTGTC